ncbi:HupE/UreJ family protein [Bradyrhizobium sp. BR 1432]|uniref:HupE/UreJ family protein n=1 Tax=Bradyrhizobium sp. BR 1432 TaxID=3447966 RepID=UPI003EE5942B
MNIRLGGVWIAAATLLASTTASEAHVIAARLGDFYVGAVHPFTDLHDIILWLAIGILGGSLGASKGRWLVLAFPLGLLAGLSLVAGLGFVPSESSALPAAMILLVGLLLAAAMPVPATLLCVIVFALAAARGAANASNLEPETNRLLFAAGLASAGYAVTTLIMALTLTFQRPVSAGPTAWRTIAIRAFGGWVAAIGLMMTGLAFAS